MNSAIDRGCLSLSRTSTTTTSHPSTAPTPSSHYCPFTSSGSTPCAEESACFLQGKSSATCRDEIVTFCQTHPQDNGCIFVRDGASGGGSSGSGSSSDYCPFQFGRESLCGAQSECHLLGMHSTQCRELVVQHCKTYPHDNGCFNVVFTNGSGGATKTYCPFTTLSAIPCAAASNCALLGKSSTECRDEIRTFCQDHSADPGCVGVERSPIDATGSIGDATGDATYCPFTTLSAIPCAAASKCALLGKSSTECRDEIRFFCQDHNADPGCVGVEKLQGASGTTGSSGETGSTGATGTSADATGGNTGGVTGSTGTTGSVSPTGPSSTGSNTGSSTGSSTAGETDDSGFTGGATAGESNSSSTGVSATAGSSTASTGATGQAATGQGPTAGQETGNNGEAMGVTGATAGTGSSDSSTGSSGTGSSTGSTGASGPPGKQYCPFTSAGTTPCDAESDCTQFGLTSSKCRAEILLFCSTHHSDIGCIGTVYKALPVVQVVTSIVVNNTLCPSIIVAGRPFNCLFVLKDQFGLTIVPEQNVNVTMEESTTSSIITLASGIYVASNTMTKARVYMMVLSATNNVKLTRTIIVLPATPSTEHSSISCPVSSVWSDNQEENMHCNVTLFDKYENLCVGAKGTLTDGTALTLSAQVQGDIDSPGTSSIGRNMIQLGPGRFSILFITPRARGVLLVAAFMSGSSKQLIGGARVSVQIIPTAVHSISTFSCDTIVVAGENIRCSLTMVDRYDLLVGVDAALTPYKTISIHNKDSHLVGSPKIFHSWKPLLSRDGKEGEFDVIFDDVRNAQMYTVNLTDSHHQNVIVVAGQLDAGKSTIRCPSQVEWSPLPFHCNISIVDSYFNSRFTDVRLVNGIQRVDAVSGAVGFGSIRSVEHVGEYQASFVAPRMRLFLNITVSIGVGLESVVVGHMHRVRLLPSTIASVSSFECETKRVVAGDNVRCVAKFQDAYKLPVGNSVANTPFEAGVALRTLSMAGMSNNISDVTASTPSAHAQLMWIAGSEGSFLVVFSNITRAGSYSLQWKYDSLNDMPLSVIQVVAAHPIASTSDISCQSESMWLRPVLCTIHLRDMHLNPSVNSSALLVELGGVAITLTTTNYTKGTAIIATFIAPSHLGLATVSARLRSARHLHQIGTMQNVTILPAPVYSPFTTLKCAPTGIAGKPFICRINTFSSEGMPTGSSNTFAGATIVVEAAGIISDRATSWPIVSEDILGSYAAEVTLDISGMHTLRVTGGLVMNVTGTSTTLVAPGDFAPAHSSFHCASFAPVSTQFLCDVYLNDIFGNPTSSNVKESMLRVPGLKVSVRSANVIGQYLLFVQSLESPGNMTVEASYYQSSGATYGFVPIGGVNPQVVSVQLTSIDLNRSSLACNVASEGVIAGNPVECIITAWKEDGSLLAAPGIANFLLPKYSPYTYQSLISNTTVQYMGVPGKYEMKFTPTIAGIFTAQFSYRGEVSNLHTPMKVLHAGMSPTTSSFKCNQANVVAGGNVQCSVIALDRFGNRIMRENLIDRALLSVAAESTKRDVSDGANSTADAAVTTLVSISLANITSPGSFYDYAISSPTLTLAKSWTLEVKLAGVTIGSAATSSHRVVVSPTTPYRDKSVLSCPSETPYLAPAACTVVLADMYGNIVMPRADMLSLFDARIEPNEEIHVKIGDNGNEFAVKFRPVSLTDMLTLSVHYTFKYQVPNLWNTVDFTKYRLESIGPKHNVTVQRVTLGNLTTAECGDATAPIVAGDLVECTVAAFDNVGAPVLEPAFGAAFQPNITSGGMPISSQVTYNTATGKYVVRYSPKIAGSVEIRIAYAASKTTNVEVGGSFHRTVIAGPVNPSTSTFRCESQPIIAGSTFSCAMRMRDTHGNVAGEAETAYKFNTFASTTGRSSVYIIGASFVKVGEYSVSMRLLYLGMWTMGMKYDGVDIPSVQVQGELAPPETLPAVSVVPGSYSIGNTTVTCAEQAPSSSVGTCHIHTFDQWGNPAQETSGVARTFRVGTVPKSSSFTVTKDKEGAYVASFATPALAQIVSVQLYVVSVSSDRVLAVPLSTSHNVTIVQTRINQNMTKATCDDSIEAGQAVTCTLEAYDMEGSLLTVPALAAAFHVLVRGTTEIPAGSRYPVTYAGPGAFAATIIARRAGKLLSTFNYMDSNGATEVGSSLEDANILQHATTITPGSPHAPSSLSLCTPTTVRASSNVQCVVLLRDQYNNSASVESSIVDALSGRATRNDGTDPVLSLADVVFHHQYQPLDRASAFASLASASVESLRHINGAAAELQCGKLGEGCSAIARQISTSRLPLCENGLGCFEILTSALVSVKGIALATWDATNKETVVPLVYQRLATGNVAKGQMTVTLPPLQKIGWWNTTITFDGVKTKFRDDAGMVRVTAESANAAMSMFQAPDEVPTSANAKVVLIARDVYGNPAPLHAKQIQVKFLPFLPFTLSSNDENTVWYASFGTPALTSNITVKASILEEEGGALKQVGMEKHMLAIQTELSASNTTFTCSGDQIVAGESLVCLLSAIDSSGARVAVPGLAPAFTMSAKGTPDDFNRVDVEFHPNSGMYMVTVSPVSTGTLTVQFKYASTIGNVPVGAPLLVQVVGAPISDLTTFKCADSTSGLIRAGHELTCSIDPRDKYGNMLLPVPSDLIMFAAIALHESGTTLTGDFAMSNNGFSATFPSLTASGGWKVKISVAGQGSLKVRGMKLETTQVVVVSSGAFDPSRSSASCASKVPGAAVGSCSIFPRDSFNNWVPPTRSNAIEFVADFSPNRLKFFVAPSDDQQHYNVKYDTPALAGTFNISIVHRNPLTGGIVQLLAPRPVDVIQVALNISSSTTSCEWQSPTTSEWHAMETNPSVVANALVRCDVFPTDEHGAPLENAALASAFALTVLNEQDPLYGSWTGTMEYPGVQPGLYTTSFLVNRSSTYHISTRYNAGSRSANLAGPTFRMIADVPNVLTSEIGCFASGDGGSGMATCVVWFRDKFYNDVVSSSILDPSILSHLTFTASSTSSTTGEVLETSVGVLSPSVFLDTRKRAYVTRYEFTNMFRSGDWSIHVTDSSIAGGANAASLRMASARVYPGTADADQSRLVCPSSVVTGGVLECRLQLRDSFGNVVGGTLVDDTSAMLESSYVSLPSATHAPAENGNYPFVNPSIVDGQNGYTISVTVNSGLAHNVTLVVYQKDIGSKTAIISAIPVELNKDRTTVQCNPSGVVEAGTTTTCTISAFEGTGVQVIQPALKSAFQCQVQSSSGEMIASITEHIHGTNQFVCSFVATKAGTVVVRPVYIMSRTRSIMLGVEKEGILFTITPSSVAQGTLHCYSNSAGVLGDVTCGVTLYDEYLNPSGNEDESAQLILIGKKDAETEVGASLEISSLSYSSAKWEEDYGKYQHTIRLTTSGKWTISLSYLRPGFDVFASEINISPISSVISISPGPFDPSTSTFECVDVALGPRLKTHCVVHARDKYSNPVGSGTSTDLSVRLALDSEVDNPSTEILLGQISAVNKVGLAEVTWTTPVLPQIVTVRLLHLTTDTFLSTTTATNYEEVTVRTVQLDVADTIIDCPSEKVVAGTPVDCVVSLFSGDQPLSEPTMAAVLRAHVDIGGQRPEVMITHQLNNRFNVRFTPTEIGGFDALASIQIVLVESGGEFLRVGQPRYVKLESNGIAPRMTKVLRCSSGYGVGTFTFCDLETYDDYGNPSGRESEATLFRLEAEHGRDSEETSIQGATIWGGLFGNGINKYQVRVNLTKSESWMLSVVHVASSPSTLIHRQDVHVDPGRPVAASSTMECDPEVICGGRASCTVMPIDVFGNIGKFLARDVLRFFPSFGGGADYDWSVAIDKFTGTAQLQFLAPVVTATIPTSMFLRDEFSSGRETIGTSTSSGPTTTINAVQRDLSSSLSSLECVSSNTTVVAGVSIGCTIEAVAPNGALVSDTALIYAFHITVNDGGSVYRVSVTDLEVVGSGKFRFAVTPKKSGVLEILAKYTVGTAVQQLGARVMNIVVGGPIRPERTKMMCFSSLSGVHGPTTCVIQTFDDHDNRVGGVSDSTALSISATHTHNDENVHDAASSNAPRSVEIVGGEYVRRGGFLFSLSLHRSGTWSIVPSVNGLLSSTLSSVVQVSPGPIDPDAGLSVFVCPQKVPSGTKVSCRIDAIDKHGNAASTDLLSAASMSVNIHARGGRRGMTSYDVKTTIDPIVRGRYLVEFTTPMLSTSLSLSTTMLSSTTGNYTSIGSTQTEVAGTILDSTTSTFVCSPLSIVAGDLVQCTILAYEDITNARPGSSLAPAFKATAAGPSEIIRVDGEQMAFGGEGVYQFSFAPRVATTGFSNGAGMVVVVSYSNGPGSEWTTTFNQMIHVAPGPINADASEVSCESIIQLPSPIICTILSFDAFKNPINDTSHTTSFGAISTHTTLQLGPYRANTTSTNARVIQLGAQGTTVAEYTVSIIVTIAAQGWDTVLSYGGVDMRKGASMTTNVRAATLDPTMSRVICPETSPALVAVSCDVLFFDQYGNGVDVAGEVPRESVDVLFHHDDTELVDAMVVSVGYTDKDTSAVPSAVQSAVSAGTVNDDSNKILVSFQAPSYKTTMVLQVHLLSTPSRPSNSPTSIGSSLNVTVTDLIQLSSINSTMGCQGGSTAVVAGTPILCFVNAVSNSGVEVGSSALSSAFVVVAISESGAPVATSNVEFSGFGGRYTFTVTSQAASLLSVSAYYNGNSGDPSDTSSMTKMNGNVVLSLMEDTPHSAKLACTPFQSVGIVRCEVDVSDQFGNPSGTSAMGNILELEAQDIQTGTLIRGEEYSAAGDFLKQGRYTVRFNIFTSEHPWTLRLSFKRTDETNVLAEHTIILTPGPVATDQCSFSCPESVFTGGVVGCVVHLKDKHGNLVLPTNKLASSLVATVTGFDPLFYGFDQGTDDTIVLLIKAPDSVSILSVHVRDTTSLERLVREDSLDITLLPSSNRTDPLHDLHQIQVLQVAISPDFSEAYCTSNGVVGEMIQCSVFPRTVNNDPVTDPNFGSMLSLRLSSEANVTDFLYAGSGKYTAMFSARFSSTNQLGTEINIDLLRSGNAPPLSLHSEKIHVQVTYGAADLSNSLLMCSRQEGGSFGIIAGDWIRCLISVHDSFYNPVNNRSLENSLELRAYDQEGQPLGFTSFVQAQSQGAAVRETTTTTTTTTVAAEASNANQNLFEAFVQVTTSGYVNLDATLSYEETLSLENSGGVPTSISKWISSGSRMDYPDPIQSKFVCPPEMDVLALNSFECFFFLVDQWGNPRSFTQADGTPDQMQLELSRGFLKVKFGKGADGKGSSSIIRENQKTTGLAYDSELGMAAQFVSTMSVIPASSNETEIIMTSHLTPRVYNEQKNIWMEVTRKDLTVSTIALVQTSPEELAMYSGALLCGTKNVVAGSSVSCNLLVKKNGERIQAPQLLALLDVRVANKQAIPPLVSKVAVGNKFLLSFVPTASGDASITVWLNVGGSGAGRLLTEIPAVVPVPAGSVDFDKCLVSAPTSLSSSSNATLSVLAYDRFSNRILRPSLSLTLHARVMRSNHNDGGANDHPVLTSSFMLSTGTYDIRFPIIFKSGRVVAYVGAGSKFTAMEQPFFHSNADVVPLKVDPAHSTLSCPNVAVVGGQIECLIRLRDQYGNSISTTFDTFASLSVEALLFDSVTSTTPTSRAAISLKLWSSGGAASVVSTGGAGAAGDASLEATATSTAETGVTVSFSFSSPGVTNVTVGLVGGMSVGSSSLSINHVPIAVPKSSISCPFSSTSAGTSVTCTLRVVDKTGDPTGTSSSSSLFLVTAASGGVLLSPDQIVVRFLSIGSFGLTFTPTRAGTLALKVQAGDQGVVDTVNPSSIEIVAGIIPSDASMLVCPQSAVSSTSSMMIVPSMLRVSCSLLLFDGHQNPILPDATTMNSMTSSINVVLRSSKDTSIGSAFFVPETGTFTTEVTPSNRGRYSLTVEYNNVTVGQVVPVGVAPGQPDPSKFVVNCPVSAVERSQVTCTLSTFDASGNPSNTRICPSSDPVVASVGGSTEESVIIDVTYSGSNCCNEQAVGDEIEGCDVILSFQVPSDALNGTSLVVGVGIASSFNEEPTTSEITIEADAFIFGGGPNTASTSGGRRRLEDAAKEVRCSGLKSYSAGDLVTCMTIVTLPSSLLEDGMSVEERNRVLQEVRTIASQERMNFDAAASNAGIDREVTTTLVASDSPVEFEYTHSFIAKRSGPTSIAVSYRGILLPVERELVEFSIASAPADPSRCQIECPEFVEAGSDLECRILLVDSFNNVVERGSPSFPTDLTAFTTTMSKMSADGTIVDRVGVVEWSEEGSDIMTRVSSFTESGKSEIRVLYGTDLLQSVRPVFIHADVADGEKTIVICPDDVLHSTEIHCDVLPRDRFSNPTEIGTMELFTGSTKDASGSTNPIRMIRNMDGTYSLVTRVGVSGATRLILSSSSKESTTTSRTMVAHTTQASSANTQYSCPVHFISGEPLSCQIVLQNQNGEPVTDGFETNALRVQLSVSGKRTDWDIVHSGGESNVFLATTTSIIAGKDAQIVVDIGLDPKSYRRRLTLAQSRRSRRLPVVGVSISSGGINAATSIMFCSNSVGTGSPVDCWIDARDSNGNPTGSASDVQAFSGTMSGTTRGTNGEAPPSSSEQSVVFDSISELFHIQFKMVLADIYTVRVAYASPENWVGIQQHPSATGSLTTKVLRGNAISANITCPTHVVRGISLLSCPMLTPDVSGNINSDPRSFLHANVTFQHAASGSNFIAVEGVHVVRSNTAWLVEIPNLPFSPGTIRVTYFATRAAYAAGTTTTAHTIIVESSTIAANSVLECQPTIVAGSPLTCTVALKNETGGVVVDSLPAGGSDSSQVDLPALSLVAHRQHANTTTYQPPPFSGSELGVAVYSMSATLMTVGVHNITATYARRSINSTGKTFDVVVTPAPPSSSSVVATCPKVASVGVEVVCNIDIRDAFGNLAGAASSAAAFHATVTGADGQPTTSPVTHVATPSPFGRFRLAFQSNQSGTHSIAVRYDGVDATSTKLELQASTPVKLTNVTCPASAVVNTTVACVIQATDALGNQVTSADALTSMRALLNTMSMSTTFINGNGDQSITMTHVVEHDGMGGDNFVLRVHINVVGTLTISTGVQWHFPSQEVTMYISEIVPSSSLVTCTGTIDVGVFACAVSGRKSNGEVTGIKAAASAWSVQLVSSVHGVVEMTVQHQSVGVFTASSLVTKSGVWQVQATFAGHTVPLNISDGGTTVVVRSSAVAASTTEISCPATSASGSHVRCIVNARDTYGNPAGIQETEAGIRAVVVLSQGQGDGAPIIADANYGGSTGLFYVNFTVPGTVADSTIVRVYASYLSTGLKTAMPVDSSGGPTPTVSFVVQPDPPPEPVPCATLSDLTSKCVVHRGKWGFTCSRDRPWKRSGGCAAGELFDVVAKICRSQCVGSPSPSGGD